MNEISYLFDQYVMEEFINKMVHYKAFWHEETLFIQGNQVHTDQNKPYFLLIKNKGLLWSVWTWLPRMNKASTCWNALLTQNGSACRSIMHRKARYGIYYANT